jgi:N-acetylneuraminic acid mutarotase
MKKIFVFILFLFITNINLQAQNTWTSKQSMTLGLGYSASFTIGNYGYVVAGFSNVDISNSTWQFDVVNNLWTQKADAGTTLRYSPVGFSVNGKGYIGMGLDMNDNTLDDLLQFDPSLNSWTQKANIPVGRFLASVMVIGNRVFIACGSTDNFNFTVLNDLWEYNTIGDSWISRTAFPGGGRYAGIGFSCGGNGYVCCGSDSGAVNLYNDLWMYNPTTDAWTAKSTLPSDPRGGVVAFTIGNYGYVGAGLDDLYSHNDFWKYDCTNDSWSAIASIPTGGRDGSFSFVINGKGYVGGGVNDNTDVISDVWEYAPDSTSSVNELVNAESVVSIAPNPVRNFAIISVTSIEKLKNPSVKIYSSNGILVKILPVISQNTFIDANQLKAGTYFFGLYSNEKFINSGKFLVIDSE